jgi:hypothetical protein
MKYSTYICRTSLLGLLSLSLGLGTALAQKPKEITPEEIEKTDPFVKGAGGAPAAENLSAEMLDAQARVLFERGEKEKAIAIQAQAVEKAKELVTRFSETLAKYEGRPVDGVIPGKLREIIIPVLDFQDTTIEEGIEFLRQRAMELDAKETDPAKKGVNFVIGEVKKTPSPFGDGDSPRIKALQLRNVSLGDALKYLCEGVKMRYKTEGNAVVILPAVEP